MERARALLWTALLAAGCEPPPPAPLLRPSALPASAVAARVRSVYDGDTLTLEDGRKIRLLAVDTPELRERQDFAAEARDFTKRLCEGRDVWLEFDAEREDRYGRLLCYVYVRDGETVRMVNAELLRAGLARFYTPGSGLRHADMLLACQREAREQGRGTWKDYVLAAPKNVVATRKGRAYHRPSCEFVRNSKELRNLEEKAALDEGLSACRECKP
jgi:micrococcal nuclease